MNIFNYTIIRKIKTDTDNIALTFDDGPHSEYTPQILDIFQKHKSNATFFCTGRNIKKYPSLLKRMSNNGHCIGNHTFNHPNALFLIKRKLKNEITDTKHLIEDITGKKNIYFRPPFGIITLPLLSICRELGLKIVLWNINSFDYREKKLNIITQRLKKKIVPGSILLFHDCSFKNQLSDYSLTVKSVNVILAYIIEKKLNPVTLEDFA